MRQRRARLVDKNADGFEIEVEKEPRERAHAVRDGYRAEGCRVLVCAHRARIAEPLLCINRGHHFERIEVAHERRVRVLHDRVERRRKPRPVLAKAESVDFVRKVECPHRNRRHVVPVHAVHLHRAPGSDVEVPLHFGNRERAVDAARVQLRRGAHNGIVERLGWHLGRVVRCKLTLARGLHNRQRLRGPALRVLAREPKTRRQGRKRQLAVALAVRLRLRRHGHQNIVQLVQHRLARFLPERVHMLVVRRRHRPLHRLPHERVLKLPNVCTSNINHIRRDVLAARRDRDVKVEHHALIDRPVGVDVRVVDCLDVEERH
eukprot:Amastigsp_a340484_22.p2 type:complete len:319 gc:universal Amastigsp_a340484_22:1124-168(-)